MSDKSYEHQLLRVLKCLKGLNNKSQVKDKPPGNTENLSPNDTWLGRG